MHRQMASTIDAVVEEITGIQRAARAGDTVVGARWPMIVLRSQDNRDDRRSLHHPTPVGLRSLDDHSGGNTISIVSRDGPSHDLDDFRGEERHQGRILDPERLVPADPHVREPGSFELLGEDTLRQGTRHSPGPGALIAGDLWGQLPLDREIRHASTATPPPALQIPQISRTTTRDEG